MPLRKDNLKIILFQLVFYHFYFPAIQAHQVVQVVQVLKVVQVVQVLKEVQVLKVTQGVIL